MEKERLIQENQPNNNSDEEEQDEVLICSPKEQVGHDAHSPSRIPIDKWNGVYIVFYIYGIIIVISWSFFVTAEGYWMYKFRETKNSSYVDIRTELQTYFTSYVSIASTVPPVIFFFINAVISKRVSHQIRLVVSLIGMTILFVVTTVFTKINTDEWEKEFLVVTIVIVVFLNSCSSVFQGALMGLAAVFPSRYMQATMNGQAAGAIFAVVANIAAISCDIKPNDSGLVFFSLACAILVMTLFVNFLFKRCTFYRYYVRQMKEANDHAEFHEIIQGEKRSYFWETYKKLLLDGYVGFVVFFVTLSVYPAAAVLVVSADQQNLTPLTNRFFIPVTCFLIFNLGDLTGRVVAGKLRIPDGRSCFYPILATLRFVFIPLMMLCNEQPRNHLPVIFHNDSVFVILNLLLGLTNGYFVNLAAIYAPKRVEVQHRELAGSLMAFFFGVGLAVGALLSDVLVSQL